MQYRSYRELGREPPAPAVAGTDTLTCTTECASASFEKLGLQQPVCLIPSYDGRILGKLQCNIGGGHDDLL